MRLTDLQTIYDRHPAARIWTETLAVPKSIVMNQSEDFLDSAGI